MNKEGKIIIGDVEPVLDNGTIWLDTANGNCDPLLKVSKCNKFTPVNDIISVHLTITMISGSNYAVQVLYGGGDEVVSINRSNIGEYEITGLEYIFNNGYERMSSSFPRLMTGSTTQVPVNVNILMDGSGKIYLYMSEIDNSPIDENIGEFNVELRFYKYK